MFFPREARKIFEPRTLESFTSCNQRSLCTKVCLQNARPPSTASILEMRSGRRRPSPGSAWWRGGCWGSCASPRALYHREDLRTRCQKILWRPAVTPDTYSSSEGHQLRFDSRHRRSAYKNDTLQAGADNDWCTRPCKGPYRPYSPTRPTTTSLTRLYLEAQSLPQSSGHFCATAWAASKLQFGPRCRSA